MGLSRRIRRYVGFILVIGTSAGLVMLHVAHAMGEDESVRTFLLGILLPLVFAGSVLVGGVILWRQERSTEHVLQIGVCSVAGAVLLALGGVSIILYQQQYGVTMDEQLFVVINGASGGVFFGFVVGIYNARQRRAQMRANQMNRQLTILNRVLRHDIRNNADVIQGNAALLTQDSVDTAARAEQIKQQATDLVRVGEQAKQIERVLETQGQGRRVFDITSLVESCCEQIRHDYPQATVEVSCDSAQRVVGHQLLESAIMNVLENAIEHNDTETPYITIETTVVSVDGTEYVELRIADDGPGIPENEVAVLERGYETELEHTSGLGLWLVNWIIRSAKGDVRFESNEPTGSVVCLRIERANHSSAPSTISNNTDVATP